MKQTISLLSILLLWCVAANAQVNRMPGFLNDHSKTRKPKHGNALQRLTVGYGQHYTYNTLALNYRSSTERDTNVITGIRSSSPMVAFINTSFPVARISERSGFNIEVGFSYTGFTFTHDTIRVPDGKVLKQDLPVSIISAPISFDFKTGGESSLNKSDRVLFSAGIGVAPSYLSAEGSESSIRAIPFAKLEAGFFAALAFKLRGMMYLGQANYINVNGEGATVPGITTQSSSGQYGFMVGLSVMPFSYQWARD